jgi:hypothetical protein
MDIYHIFCNLKDGVGDLVFAENLKRYLDHLKAERRIESWRLTRRKLGLGPHDMGEFHIMIETEDLAQLERAFRQVSERAEPVESRHFDVNSLVRDARFALYRDFPDPWRKTGAERF